MGPDGPGLSCPGSSVVAEEPPHDVIQEQWRETLEKTGSAYLFGIQEGWWPSEIAGRADM